VCNIRPKPTEANRELSVSGKTENQVVLLRENKKLSYRGGTARRAMLVNSCCFMKYGSEKGLKQQKWPSRSFKGNGAIRDST